MRILLCGMGPFVNMGDRAILIALTREIYENYADVIIEIQGNLVELETSNLYDANLMRNFRFVKITAHPFTRNLRNLFGFERFKRHSKSTQHSTLDQSKLLLSMFTVCDLVLMRFFNVKPLGADFRVFENADKVIMGGGTQLESVESMGIFPRFIHNLSTITMAMVFNKPSFIYGQSIGPIHNHIGRYLTRNILSRLTGAYVREDESVKYLNNDLKISNIVVKKAGDCVFLLYKSKIVESYKGQFTPERDSIGICMRNILQISKDRLLLIFKDFISSVIDILGYKVYLYPQVTDENNEFHNDYKICLELYHQLDEKYRRNTILLDTRHWSIFESIYFLNGLKILVSMRMHPIIFRLVGINRKHNFIAISHIHKFQGVVNDLGAKQALIPWNALTSDLLIEKVLFEAANEADYSSSIVQIKKNLVLGLREILSPEYLQ